MGAACDLRWMQGLIPAVASGWRDTMFECPFRQRLGRTKFAEPSRGTAMPFNPSLKPGTELSE